jgi:glycosyltransferase involved in cell wall biosynthesis
MAAYGEMALDGRIAVVIPARNAARFLGDALDSVRAQDLRPAEIVVVDDGSTDGTGAIATAFGHGVTCLRAGGVGPAAARNIGVRATASPLVAFLDADDIWLPEKTSRQMMLLAAHPELALVCSDMRTFEGRSQAPRTHFQEQGFNGISAASSIFLFDMIATPTVIVRREILQILGGFDESLTLCSEADLWFRVGLHERFAAISEPLVMRRYHAGNITRDAVRLSAAIVQTWERYLGPIIEREPHMRRQLEADFAARRWQRHCLEGVVALHEGRRPDARRLFVEAIRARPGRARSWAFLAASFLGDSALRRLRNAGPGGRH